MSILELRMRCVLHFLLRLMYSISKNAMNNKTKRKKVEQMLEKVEAPILGLILN